jgi:type I restriction enzyme S subunit
MSWAPVSLGDVCGFVRGPFGGSLKKEIFKDEGFAVFEQQHAINDQFSKIRYFVDEAKFLEMKRFELAPGDLIMSCSGTMGKVAIVPNGVERGIINQALLKITPQNNVDVRFLRYWMESNDFQRQLTANTSGAAIKNVASVGVLKELQIPLPPLEEQKRIAGILDQADALRRLRTRALEKLNTLGQAIFHEMFGDALSGQFFGFGKAVVEFRYGTSNKSGEGGLPTLRIPNVIGGGIDTGEIKTVEVTGPEQERLRLIDGDVLFVRTNGNPDYVGRCASFSQDAVADYGTDTDWIFASYLIRARLSDRINPVFAKTYFASQIGRKAIRERCKTSAGQFNINTDGLGSLPFPDVPREKQDSFAEIVAAIDTNSAPMKVSAEAMERKFASLQDRAFRGEL